MQKHIKQNKREFPRKYPQKQTGTPKTETIKFRCTNDFKKIAAKLSTWHKRDLQIYWSESDILHEALAFYIKNKSPYYKSFTIKEQEVITKNLMP